MSIEGPVCLADFLTDQPVGGVPGVYLWFYEKKLIYVGKADNIFERNRSHAILQVTGVYSILDSKAWKPKNQKKRDKKDAENEVFRNPKKLVNLVRRAFKFRDSVTVHWIQIEEPEDRKFVEATLIDRHWANLDNRKREAIPLNPTGAEKQALKALESLFEGLIPTTSDQSSETQADPRSLAESEYLDESAKAE